MRVTDKAHALANGCHDVFDPSLRTAVNLRTLKWDVLPQALLWGRKQKRSSRGQRPLGNFHNETGNYGNEELSMVHHYGCSGPSAEEVEACTLQVLVCDLQ